MTVITRFAPSPTGRLHVGNIRTALHNWMLAKKEGGRFLLRIDDTDAQRSREEYVDAIRIDLAWMGLDVDGEERQSARFALYEASFARLVEQGRIYRCYETAQELELKRKVLLGRGLPPIYDRGALQLTETAREVLKGQRTVQLRRPVKRKSTPSRSSSSTVVSDLSPADDALFQLLRKWRADTAREQAVPAYVILHDKTLRELAEARPTSYGLLAGITGMGNAKIEHYGAELLDLIRNEG